MKEPLISIIVPVYNVKPFLERCVKSCVFQTYKNIEILLVDDGSTDGSGELCDELARKYQKVSVFHKLNGGLSDARNYGMDRMKGEYFFFVDSDDYLNSNALMLMYHCCEALGLDIIECEFKKVSSTDMTNFYFDSFSCEKNSTLNFIFQNIKFSKHYPMAWNKLYKTSLFGKCRFKFQKLNEDEFFVNSWLNLTSFVGYISAPLYYYQTRDESIMAKPYNIKRVDGIEAYVERLGIVKRLFPKAVDNLEKFIIEHSLAKIAIVENENLDDDKKIRNRIAKTLEPIRREIVSCPVLGPLNKEKITNFLNEYLGEI